MADSFFFYDLETSGINPREARVMQFAGQRTDMDLRPVGEPYNILIKLTPDVLPEPDAVLLTGITPQATLAEGVTEAEFLKLFHGQIVRPGTIFLGYNTVRFDDEFMRFLHYRNFYDAYEWQYLDGCSRWDLLDVVRLTRALRPEGIEWPFTEDGKATNRLELITQLNGLAHDQAHDALSDVTATIAVAKLIRDKQPKLFDFLLSYRSKKEVEKLVCQEGQPFVYACGRYPSETHKTTVAVRVADNPNRGGCLVYDLRHDPSEFLAMTPEQLAERWQWAREPDAPRRLPVKPLQFNRCPAVAPLAVLDEVSRQRIGLDLAAVKRHLRLLRSADDWPQKLVKALAIKEAHDKQRWAAHDVSRDVDEYHGAVTHDDKVAPMIDGAVDGKLYDGFVGPADKQAMRAVRAATPSALDGFADQLQDERLRQLLPLYKARNYPDSLSDDERRRWEAFIQRRLVDGGQTSRLARYFGRLQELAAKPDLTSQQSYLLEELQLYGQSVIPGDLD